MGKKSTTSIPQKHIHSRLSYLYQAATYLSKQDSTVEQAQDTTHSEKLSPSTSSGQSRYLVNHIKGVSKKSVIRLTSEVKHTICKRCDSLLEADGAAIRYIENKSRNKSKAWADILVIECTTCQTRKRFPTGKTLKKPRGNSNGLSHVQTIEALSDGIANVDTAAKR